MYTLACYENIQLIGFGFSNWSCHGDGLTSLLHCVLCFLDTVHYRYECNQNAPLFTTHTNVIQPVIIKLTKKYNSAEKIWFGIIAMFWHFNCARSSIYAGEFIH